MCQCEGQSFAAIQLRAVCVALNCYGAFRALRDDGGLAASCLAWIASARGGAGLDRSHHRGLPRRGGIGRDNGARARTFLVEDDVQVGSDNRYESILERKAADAPLIDIGRKGLVECDIARPNRNGPRIEVRDRLSALQYFMIVDRKGHFTACWKCAGQQDILRIGRCYGRDNDHRKDWQERFVHRRLCLEKAGPSTQTRSHRSAKLGAATPEPNAGATLLVFKHRKIAKFRFRCIRLAISLPFASNLFL